MLQIYPTNIYIIAIAKISNRSIQNLFNCPQWTSMDYRNKKVPKNIVTKVTGISTDYKLFLFMFGGQLDLEWCCFSRKFVQCNHLENVIKHAQNGCHYVISYKNIWMSKLQSASPDIYMKDYCFPDEAISIEISIWNIITGFFLCVCTQFYLFCEFFCIFFLWKKKSA